MSEISYHTCWPTSRKSLMDCDATCPFLIKVSTSIFFSFNMSLISLCECSLWVSLIRQSVQMLSWHCWQKYFNSSSCSLQYCLWPAITSCFETSSAFFNRWSLYLWRLRWPLLHFLHIEIWQVSQKSATFPWLMHWPHFVPVFSDSMTSMSFCLTWSSGRDSAPSALSS